MTVYGRAVDIMEAEVAGELVALDVRSGDCFVLNEVAVSVWRSLAQPKSFEQLRDELLDEYQVAVEDCSRELQELLDDLVQADLVEKVD